MKRLVAFSFLFLAACGSKAPDGIPGYVESDALMMAPQDAGRVSQVVVAEGDHVSAGSLLFRLDPSRLEYTAEQAAASASAAGARAAAQGALAQAVAEAEAQYRNAQISYERSKKLYAERVIAKARLDADLASFDAAKARLERARSEQAAAEREWSAATASEDLARKRVSDLEVYAPAAGTIERIYRRGGEIVGAGEPVLSLLPPENVKVRFYAPQAMLPTLQPGAEIVFTCDGCVEEQRAKISYIAREPQFTPPVIYSLDERDKLVFLIEARPLDPENLRPGLPVTVKLP